MLKGGGLKTPQICVSHPEACELELGPGVEETKPNMAGCQISILVCNNEHGPLADGQTSAKRRT